MESDQKKTMYYFLRRQKDGKAEMFHASVFVWTGIIKLSLIHGADQGARIPEERPFFNKIQDCGQPEVAPGGYIDVTDEDAAKMVRAIERALLDIPDEDVVTHLYKAGVDPSKVNPHQLFCTHIGKNKLREFTEYCKGGGFEVRFYHEDFYGEINV